MGAQCTFLSDAAQTVHRGLEIQEYTDPKHNPMIPHTVVLELGLLLHKIYNGYWSLGRPSATELWQDLRDIACRIRPDRDPRPTRAERELGSG